MDLSKKIIAKSDQLNADDLIGGPQTFTVVEVKDTGNEDQPVSIILAEWPSNRPFKPSKTVARILAYCLGAETDDWPPNVRMTLFRDEKVKWAGEEVGGIRVSHLSHIKGPQKIALQESKHKKSLHTILPLPDAPTQPPALTDAMIACATDIDQLREWHRQHPGQRAAIEARVADLKALPVEVEQPAEGGAA
jgi:hypothetical protein